MAVREARVLPRILSTGKPAQQRGFTLLELMLVILVMGLFTGIVSLSVDRQSGPDLRVEGERVQYFLRGLQQRAVYRAQDTGVVLTGRALVVRERIEGIWVPVTPEIEMPLKDALSFELLVEGQLVQPLVSVREVLSPQLVFYSDGQHPPFVMQVTSASGSEVVLNGLFEQRQSSGR